jgi:hypothetical protein
MTHAEMVTEARKDLKALRNMLEKPLRDLRREHLLDIHQPIQHMIPWCSPNLNNWLVMIKCVNSTLSVYTLAWFPERDRRLAGLWITAKGLSYFIDADVIERYGDHFDPSGSTIDRLQSFFFENHFYAMQVEDQRDEDRWNVSVGLDQGMGLGEWDIASDIVHLRTFVEHGELFEQEKKADVRADRLFNLLTHGQRIELGDRLRTIASRKRNTAA